MTELAATPGLEGSKQPQHDLREFRRALGTFATGVTIVTATHNSRMVGVTANSFSSVSLDPPLVLWSIDRKSTSLDTFLSTSHFAVNILAESQTELSSKFSRTSDEKFTDIDWTHGIGGAALLTGAVTHLECSREIEYEGGDHIIMIGRVQRYTAYDREPLVFARGRYVSVVDPQESEPSAIPAGSNSESVEAPALLHSLLRAYDGISEKFDAHRRAEGLSPNQSRVLALLNKGPADSLSEVIRGALLSEDAAVDSMENLRSRGLSEQTVTGGYTITSAGLEAVRRLAKGLREVELDVTAHAPGLDLETARNWLAIVARQHGRHGKDEGSKPRELSA